MGVMIVKKIFYVSILLSTSLAWGNTEENCQSSFSFIKSISQPLNPDHFFHDRNNRFPKSKIKPLYRRIRKHLREGSISYTSTASLEMIGEHISKEDIKIVLQNLYHEKRRDNFSNNHWTYAFLGRIQDNRVLRVVVSFESDRLSIVTAYEVSLTE